ncbi:MAG: GTPase domain-containing protein [Planctomycetaceae bacterium]|jgi:GTPase SAR1 family protein|nr:GTPase domain-containing protein [Planctomycetaceae bacterium]
MKVRLFIYGSVGSGKTSFFRQLIQGNVLQGGLNQKLSKFISSSVSSTGQVIPTTVGVDGLEVKLDRDCYVISDWKGELLSASVSGFPFSDSGWIGRRNDRVTSQLLRSDAVLFFFDPTAQSVLDSIRPLEQIQRHHYVELLRAKQIIDFVLRVRQNNFVPIIFVLTHCDLFEVISGLRERTEIWADAVNRYLYESYEDFFRGYYPKSLVCREQLFYYVSTVSESKQPRKSLFSPQAGTVPAAKVDAVNWVESFPFAVDLANILRAIPKHIDLIKFFRRRDRRRCYLVLFLFLLCLCLVFLVPIILGMQRGQVFIGKLQKQVSSVIDRVPQLKSMLEDLPKSEAELELKLRLLEESANLDVNGAAELNESINILMRRLNKLENASGQNSEKYKEQFIKWTEAIQKVERLFDVGAFESGRVKLELFGVILGKLSDSSARVTPQLDSVLKKYWNFYRAELVLELSGELQVNADAGLSGKQQLEMLCLRLERFFREINNSRVRGDSFSLRASNRDSDSIKSLKDSNQKERLRQDIRKCFKSCENFLVNYPVEIRFKEVLYSSEVGIDRDFVWRVKVAGVEGNPIYVDLAIAPGYRNDKICQFLPVKDRLTVLLNFDSRIQISLERMYKGGGGTGKNRSNNKEQMQEQEQIQEQRDQEIMSGWQEVLAWQVEQRQNEKSLEGLGIKFYLQFENETNTIYSCEGEGMKIQMAIKRARTVPDLLWEITN